MNKDIRIKISLFGHLKTKKLIRRLKHEGFYSLLCLWAYAAINKPRGVLCHYDHTDIALAAEWNGDPDEFVGVLVECRFLETNEDGFYQLHDWEEHNPFAFHAEERSEIARKNAKKRWEKKCK